LEELRIVEGQGQNSEVITPPEEINRMNELGKQEICRIVFENLRIISDNFSQW